MRCAPRMAREPARSERTQWLLRAVGRPCENRKMIERTIPILPCGPELDPMVEFYEALGFTVTHRQAHPYAHLAVNRGGLDLHFGGFEGFDPENSTGSAIVVVEDSGQLFNEFAEGLRAAYGRLPIEGIPRITRPRRKQGMSGGFSVVDPGGNWLRVTAASEPEEAPAGVLDRVLLNATRQGDSHGDVATAITVLETGLVRHPDATPAELAPALAYLAELLTRGRDTARAVETLDRLAELKLTQDERDALVDVLAGAAELRASL
jgi:hypothetical protein